jgi:predicted nucleic acid-binding protein
VTFLLDTNVVCELHKSEQRMDKAVHEWASAQSLPALYLSVITVMELEIGVARVERRDHAQGARLRVWLTDRVLPAFARRVLPVDLRVVRRSAALRVPDPRPERDALIAATALVHDLVVVTKNESDFSSMGARTLNPWSVPPN